MNALKIINGRVIDPANNVDAVHDIYIDKGVFVKNEPANAEVIDAKDLVVAPGLIDIHVHLREPGQSAKETIESGTRAAAAGGFTTVVCMPNTSPAIDSTGTILWIQEKARQTAVINVLCSGAITKGLAGEELSPIGSLAAAGAVAITDDGHCIQNHEVMRRAAEYARMFGLVIMDHCQDYSLVGNGVMHEGDWSIRLGLPGWPRIGEEVIVARNILLSELCGTPIHCQHLTSGGSVSLIREAKKRGIQISGEVCPHHISLTDARLKDYDTNYKMNPPLRTEADIELLIGGIADGTIDILASDHAPHAAYEKEVEFEVAPFGIIGLETEFGIFSDILVHQQKAIDLPRLIALLTANPARLLGLDRGTLSPGKPADVTLIHPDLEWKFCLSESQSRSRNSPYDGHSMKGRAVRTIVGGKTVWKL